MTYTNRILGRSSAARRSWRVLSLALLVGTVGAACEHNSGSNEPASLPRGLVLALAEFKVAPDGRVLPEPMPAKLLMLAKRGGSWISRFLVDPQSNAFHKAMAYQPPNGVPGILTLGANAATIKLWRPGAGGLKSETLWEATFGGKHNRMRDAEIGNLLGAGQSNIAVATHDQGVVAVVSPRTEGVEIKELDRRPDTFVHEIEIGDLDDDGVNEIYATPSEPNRFDGTPQRGSVVRYIPGRNEGRTVVIDLGTRHAKEILVSDVDGDGRQELYVSVEAETEGKGESMRIRQPVEIRRYTMTEGELRGTVVATLDDALCRFLTFGDVDGDGRRELVAAPWKSGLWLLRPQKNPSEPWAISSIDKDSSGFEHAAYLTDLDGNGRDELYVASDGNGEVRRYMWQDGKPIREIIHRHPVPDAIITWNIMAVPVELIPE